MFDFQLFQAAKQLLMQEQFEIFVYFCWKACTYEIELTIYFWLAHFENLKNCLEILEYITGIQLFRYDVTYLITYNL